MSRMSEFNSKFGGGSAMPRIRYLSAYANYLEDSTEFIPKGENELRATIGDDTFRGTMVSIDAIDVHNSHVFCRCCFEAGNRGELLA